MTLFYILYNYYLRFNNIEDNIFKRKILIVLKNKL